MKTSVKTRTGFTLVELLVVIAIIVLLAAIALPSIARVLTAGADAQTYNLIAGQLIAARALAIQRAAYTGVHVQMADATVNKGLRNTCYSAVMIHTDPNDGPPAFRLADGFEPHKLEGTTALGQAGSPYLDPNGRWQAGELENLDRVGEFISFTVVFSPSGTVVRQPAGRDAYFDPNDPLFKSDSGAGRPRLWDPEFANADTNPGDRTGPGEPGAAAMVIFDYGEFVAAGSGGRRADYLSRSGIFVPVNVYTGQLFPRK